MGVLRDNRCVLTTWLYLYSFSLSHLTRIVCSGILLSNLESFIHDPLVEWTRQVSTAAAGRPCTPSPAYCK